MKISNNGLDLIREFEGLRLSSYVCSGGVLTIGYGSTGSHVRSGMTITKQEAEDLLLKDVARFEDAVNSLVVVPLNQGQFDALVSFAFNLGSNALAESTLLRLLNVGDYEGAASQFDRWVKAGAVTLEGLVRRRNAEEALFRCGGAKESVCERPEKIETVARIRAKRNTVLKKEPVDSSTLPRDQKVSVEEGKEYSLIWIGKEGDNHIKVSLAYGGGNWFIYTPHWDGLPDTPTTTSWGGKILNVPYFTQRDNYRDSHRTCFSSSCAMLTEFLKPGTLRGSKGDDKYVKQVFKRGDSTDPSVQLLTLSYFGIDAKFIQNGTNALLTKQIDEGKPVPVGILHKGPASAPSGGGHWLVVVGYRDNPKAPGGGHFICHDPWGELQHSLGVYNSTDGIDVAYSYAMFDSRWTVAGYSDGWCIIV